ncbi:MAG: hypothetical protein JWO06_714, partial [Bacteroidota bacterium]|nr:hypothetical protein [Bacteroidota bacterium]
LQSLKFYAADPKIAGISLFNYQTAENGFFPFYPALDGYDNYFIQLASSWGQIFFSESWGAFRDWLKMNDKETLPGYLPQYLQQWSASSWKKHLNHFLVAQDLYFVFPRVGLSTNFGEPGVNTDRRGLFQTQLLEGEKQYRFSSLTESKAVYDAWFEMAPEVLNRLNPLFAGYKYDVDLHRTKQLAQISSEFLLSSKKCSKALFSFANDMQSAEENVIHNVGGTYYSFSAKQNFEQNGDTDVADHYVGLSSIRDIAFHTFITNIETTERKRADDRITAMGAEIGAKMKTFVDDFHFNMQYPKFQISIIYQDDVEKLKASVGSVFNQHYPSQQFSLSVFYTGNDLPAENNFPNTEWVSYTGATDFADIFSSTMNRDDTTYNVVISAGDVFLREAFLSVNKIFQKYPDINWLTGSNASGLASQRWNSRIFELSLKKYSDRKIIPANTFWKRYLWDTAALEVSNTELDNFYNKLWATFFKKERLFTCLTNFSSNRALGTGLLEDSLVNKLYESFYLNDVAYLRSIYKEKNQLPDVLRFDSKSRTYFLSGY